MGLTRWSQAIQVAGRAHSRFPHFQDEPVFPDRIFVLSLPIRERFFFEILPAYVDLVPWALRTKAAGGA